MVVLVSQAWKYNFLPNSYLFLFIMDDTVSSFCSGHFIYPSEQLLKHSIFAQLTYMDLKAPEVYAKVIFLHSITYWCLQH